MNWRTAGANDRSAPPRWLGVLVALLLLGVMLSSAVVASAAGVRFEDTDARIVYLGQWSPMFKVFHSGGEYTYTQKAGAKAIIRFKGTAIDYVTNKDIVYGIAKVTLDGGLPSYVDLYSPVRNLAQSVVWSASGLADANHVLTIEFSGTKNPASTRCDIGLDAVDITGTLLNAVVSATPSAGSHGAISPSSVQTAVVGDAGPTFTLTPDAHYHVADVLLDGTSVGAVTSYRFAKMDADHTLAASFAIDTYNVDASASAHGSISPVGRTAVAYGATQQYAITPDVGSHIVDVVVDGSSVGAVSSWSFGNVTAPHTISATFAIDTFTISASAGAHGAISPAGDFSADWGSSPTFTFTPDTHYHVTDVVVDGVSVGAASAYTFTAVTKPHTISVAFGADAVKRYEQTDPLIVYKGPWNRLAKPFHSGGSYDYTVKPGASAIIRFRGTAIDYITNKDNLYGIMSVSLDGGAPVDVDLYSPVRNIAQSVVWSAHDLTEGEHTLVLTCTGRANPAAIRHDVGLDCVEIEGVLLDAALKVTPDAGTHGSISPSAVQTMTVGDSSPTFLITPDAHYHIADVLVDGVSVGTPTSYAFTKMTTDHTLSARFAIDTNDVAASSGEHGQVSPAGTTAVEYGADQRFDITPDAHYHVADVLVDGTSVGAVTSYDFSDVIAAHTISATFAIDTFAITPSAGSHGAISPSSAQTVAFGGSAHFDITPDAHYHVDDVLVDGVSVGAVTSYDFSDVAGDHTISATFELDTFVITPTAGAHGDISPNATQIITYGWDSHYEITPQPHYHVADVLVDGASVGAVTSYDFRNVSAGHTISVTFAIDTSAITASAGSHGSISPAGATQVDYGKSQSYTITPDAHYHVADVVVDGTSVGAVTSYDFSDVTEAHTISATFAIDTYTITPSSGPHVTLTPSSAQTVDYGSSKTFTIDCDAGYHVDDVLVDGASVGAVTQYTFTNVHADHTISASYAGNVYNVTASAGSNGAVTPSGTTQVGYGQSKSYTIAPDTGYHIADVLVDGSSVGAVTSYQFTNVTAAHTISATFAINTFTVTPSAGSGGSISPATAQTVNYGSNSQTFTITPNSGYIVSDVTVDGEDWGVLPAVQLTNVTANHTISVTFQVANIRVEQTDSHFYYQGTWQSRTKVFHSGGTYACTQIAGAKVTIKWHGPNLTYVTNKDSIYGIGKFTLDGGTPTYVDLYSGTRNVFQAKVWSASGLANTDHTLVVECTGTKNPASGGYWVGLDAVDIAGGTLLQAP